MYALRTWNPWRELQQLQQEMGRLFRSESRPSAGVSCPLNVWANDDGAIVTTELPGIDPEQLEVNVTNGVLKIAGKYESHTLSEGQKYQRRERTEQAFERTLQLPFAVDTQKTEAEYRNGVLEVRLFRSEDEKPRKVTVKAG